MEVTSDTILKATAVRKTVVNNYQGSVIRPVAVLDEAFVTLNDALPDVETYNAPAVPLVSDPDAGILVWVRPEATTHICVYPVLRADTVVDTDAEVRAFFIKDGIAPGAKPYLRGTPSGVLAVVAGPAITNTNDPYYSATTETAHAKTITYTDSGECIATPVVFGGAAGTNSRKGIIFDVQSAPYVVFALNNKGSDAIALEVEEM